MNDEAERGARVLRDTYGRDALDECWRRLDAATAARDHAAGVHWADVAMRLRERDART